jgi:sugar phosphate isomerase/epimerase
MAVLRPDMKIRLGGTARRPEDVISLQKLALRFAEITIVDPVEFRSLKDDYLALLPANDFFYICHGPMEGNPNDLHALETVYFQKLLHVLSIMPELEMRLLTVHLWMDPRVLPEKTISYKIGFLERLTEKARRSGVTICLENLSENFFQLERVFSVVPALNLTLDLGHAELLSEENTSFGFLENCPDRIKHIHLHDNYGGSSPDDDLHLPVGEGKIDFQKIFQKLNSARYRGTITLELRPVQIESCLAYVEDLVRLIT